MPIQPVLRYPHPVLKKVCRQVEIVDTTIQSLVDDLLDTMHAGPGSVGVAAPQIGVTLRVCVVDVSASRQGKENNHGQLCMISVYGADQPGIVYRVTRELAALGVNITDLNTKLIGTPEEPVYVMMLEAAIPEGQTPEGLEGLLGDLKKELNVEIGVRIVTPVAF